MTDKQIINTLRNIQNCCDYPNCVGCYFDSKDDNTRCILKVIFLELATYPDLWDMEEIERIIND